MPFVNYQRRPLVFNEMGKPINDLSMEDAIKEANLDYKVGIKETRVRLEDPANPGSFLLYKVPNSLLLIEKIQIMYLVLLVLSTKLYRTL